MTAESGPGEAGRDALAEVIAERDRLQDWKDQALPVIFGLQELGRALQIPLGRSITGPDALEAVTRMRADHAAALAQAEARVEKAERLMADAHKWERVAHEAREQARRDLRAALTPDAADAHDRRVRARALREASEAIESDLPGSDASGYYASESVSGYNEAARHAESWLRDRADREEAGQEPRPRPGGDD